MPSSSFVFHTIILYCHGRTAHDFRPYACVMRLIGLCGLQKKKIIYVSGYLLVVVWFNRFNYRRVVTKLVCNTSFVNLFATRSMYLRPKQS